MAFKGEIGRRQGLFPDPKNNIVAVSDLVGFGSENGVEG
jgi:hypothetical protein